MGVVSKKSSWRKHTLQTFFGLCFSTTLFSQREPFSFTLAYHSLASVSFSGQRNATALSHHGSIQARALGFWFFPPLMAYTTPENWLSAPLKKGWLGIGYFFSPLTAINYLVWLWTIVFIFFWEGKIWGCTWCHVKMACVQDTCVFFLTFCSKSNFQEVSVLFGNQMQFVDISPIPAWIQTKITPWADIPQHGGIQFTSDLAWLENIPVVS